MSDTSPRQGMTKKSDKSLQEKRHEKRDEAPSLTFSDLAPSDQARQGRKK